MIKESLYPIVFLRTKKMKENREFYEDILQLPVALEQEECIIYRIGSSGYWGFCETKKRIKRPADVCLTLVLQTREDVDNMHKYLKQKGIKIKRPPQETSKYKIYNGFYIDPNGYVLEIQAFDEDGKPEGHDSFFKLVY